MKVVPLPTSHILQMQKINYFLENYAGIDRKMISYFKKQNTRAVTIFKNYPMIYLCDHQVGLVSAFDDDEDQWPKTLMS